MKFKEPLDDILNARVKVKILRSLILKGVELTGRQISEEIRMSPPTAHKALRDLVDAHVLLLKRAGTAKLFKLNHENYLVQQILVPLFKKESKLLSLALDVLTKNLRLPILSLILYGSLAKGEETSHSDIDLAVIIDPKNKTKCENTFDKIKSSFQKRYGRELSPHFIIIKEFKNKYQKRDPFMVEVIKTGVVINGKLISELLNYGR